MKSTCHDRKVTRSGSTALLAVVTLAALGSAGCSVSDAKTAVEDDTAVITWSGNASRICVTAPDVVCPSGKDDKIKEGKVYWVLDATCFPGGISGPVKYGVKPNCAKDKTADNNGAWEPMVKGQTYQITIAGFGGSPSTTEMTFGEP
jgi:hypothetical protein